MSRKSTVTVQDRARSDPEAWVDRHGDAMYRYALARLGDRDLAEELVQEALVAALGSRDRFKLESAERTWLIGILRHKIVDQFRRAGRAAAQASDPFVSGLFDRGFWKERPKAWARDPGAALENEEFWATFEQCLAKLPGGMGGVFRLRELDQLETTEICRILDITGANVFTLLYRARVRLRRCLESNWFEQP